jgi:hypothetical protein
MELSAFSPAGAPPAGFYPKYPATTSVANILWSATTLNFFQWSVIMAFKEWPSLFKLMLGK